MRSNMVRRVRWGARRSVGVGGQFLGEQKMVGDGSRPYVVGLVETQPMRRTVLACLLAAIDVMDVRAELMCVPWLF